MGVTPNGYMAMYEANKNNGEFFNMNLGTLVETAQGVSNKMNECVSKHGQRKCDKYFKALQGGFSGTFEQWQAQRSETIAGGVSTGLDILGAIFGAPPSNNPLNQAGVDNQYIPNLDNCDANCQAERERKRKRNRNILIGVSALIAVGTATYFIIKRNK